MKGIVLGMHEDNINHHNLNEFIKWNKWEQECLWVNRSLKELGLKHLPLDEVKDRIEDIKQKHHPINLINNNNTNKEMMNSLIPPTNFLGDC